MATLDKSKVNLLLLLILSCCFCMYLNDPLDFISSLNENVTTSVDKDPEQIFGKLVAFKEDPPKKEFGIEDVVLVTAFSENHFTEAL